MTTMAKAEAALVEAVELVARNYPDDEVLGVVFLLVHESSGLAWREAMRNGATICGPGFALGVVQRTAGPMDGIPHDMIAALVCVGDEHKAIGIPVEQVRATLH
jgi:hypothetical protein